MSLRAVDMSGLNQVFNPTRLQVVAFLSGCERADYSAVQEYCQLSQSTLSKSLTLLIDNGYVDLTKVAAGRYTKTVLALTPSGRAALAEHLDELQRIAADARQASSLATAPTEPALTSSRPKVDHRIIRTPE